MTAVPAKQPSRTSEQFVSGPETASADGGYVTCPPILDSWQTPPQPCDPEWLAIAAERLRHEATRARLAPNGQHPKIETMTHAAALQYAASILDGWADAYRPAPYCPLHSDGLSCPPEQMENGPHDSDPRKRGGSTPGRGPRVDQDEAVRSSASGSGPTAVGRTERLTHNDPHREVANSGSETSERPVMPPAVHTNLSGNAPSETRNNDG